MAAVVREWTTRAISCVDASICLCTTSEARVDVRAGGAVVPASKRAAARAEIATLKMDQSQPLGRRDYSVHANVARRPWRATVLLWLRRLIWDVHQTITRRPCRTLFCIYFPRWLHRKPSGHGSHFWVRLTRAHRDVVHVSLFIACGQGGALMPEPIQTPMRPVVGPHSDSKSQHAPRTKQHDGPDC